MAKTVIDIDDEELALAAEVLGTKTKKDTVNAALAAVAARARRRKALEALIELDRQGAFDKAREPGFKREVRGAWAVEDATVS
ncbi:type II toxin-antitoxin system VapB family antitoxin [Streptomyces sp. B6B3]|jgi:Arc/MetJ family transcription regulator|uniref:type II toxin-antitoxin system VapB family antitoxin n=1 Tax=Streptomyces sp. B6B3 TaxID=3153570 RepID=UPI00325DC4BD